MANPDDNYALLDTCWRTIDQLKAELAKSREREAAAARLLERFYDDRYDDGSDCEELDCDWCITRREVWPFVKDLTGAPAPPPCPHVARIEALETALRELYGRLGACHGVIMGYGCGSGFHNPRCATAALAPP